MQIQSEAMARNRAFWADQLGGYETPRQLQGPENKQPVARSRVQFWLDAAEVDMMAQAAAKSGATLFMVLAAAYAGAVLQSLQLSDIVFTTTSSLRRMSGLQECIGCLIDTAPLHIKMPQASSDYQQLLKQVLPWELF